MVPDLFSQHSRQSRAKSSIFAAQFSSTRTEQTHSIHGQPCLHHARYNTSRSFHLFLLYYKVPPSETASNYVMNVWSTSLKAAERVGVTVSRAHSGAEARGCCLASTLSHHSSRENKDRSTGTAMVESSRRVHIDHERRRRWITEVTSLTRLTKKRLEGTS